MWNYFLQNLTPAGMILAVAGVIWFIRKRKLEGLALGLIFLFAGPAFAFFANPYLLNPITQGVFERFYILPSIPLAFFIAAGIFITVDFISKFTAKYSQKIVTQAVAVTGLIVVAASLTVMVADRYPSIRIYDNPVTENYGKDLLEPLEPDSLLILTDDHNFSATIYAQLVLGYRTDVVILHAEILKLPSYVAQQKRQHPQIKIPFNAYQESPSASLEALINANIRNRAVYGVGNIKEKISAFDKAEWGLCYRFLQNGEGQNPYVLMSPQISQFLDFHFPDKVYPITSWEFVMAYQYGRLAFTIASDLQKPQAQPDAALVEKMYRSAILNAPGYMASYKNLGLLLWKNSGSPTEVISLWERYLQEVPNDPDKEQMLQTMAQLGAR